MQKWRSERGNVATYRNLAGCFNTSEEQNLMPAIQKVCSVITDHEIPMISSENSIKKWTSEMVNEFTDLVEDTKVSFQEQIDPAVLAGSVPSLHILGPDQSKELKEATCVEDVFCTLSPHWSFVNYNLLASLIEKYGTGEDHQNLAKYVKEFELFSECRVSDVPSEKFTTSDDDQAQIVTLYIELENNELQLKQVLELKRALAECLEVNASMLQLKSVEERPVGRELSLTLLLPDFMAKEVFPLSTPTEVSLSHCIPNARIVSLTCDEYIFKVRSQLECWMIRWKELHLPLA